MEHVVSAWLRNFETGKMTRRQLVQTLTAAIAAGSATAAMSQTTPPGKPTLPPPQNPTPWKTVWLDHVSYAVSDYRRSSAFYRDLLGWEVIHDDGEKQCSMKVGQVGGIIIRNASTYRGIFDDVQPGAAARVSTTGVVDHISWGIQPWDTDSVKRELERRGLKPRPDMNADFQSFHVLDPDGWDLQISNQRDTSKL